MSSNGVAKTHQSCPICTHNDCVTVFSNGTAWCHSHCIEGKDKPFKYNQETIETKATQKIISADNSRYSFGALTDRKIAEDTARKYGVKVTYNYEGKIAEHMYPFYSENTLTATKIRTVSTKDFRWTGSATEAGLFGEHLFKSGGKYLLITEGECDAMASYELMGSKWPVVSIKGGAGSAVKDIRIV